MNWNQIGAWLAGELEPEAAAAVEAWVRAVPARADEIARVRGIWQATGTLPVDWDAQAALGQLKQTARDRGLMPAFHGAGRRRVSGEHRAFHLPSGGWWVSGLAAALVVLTIGALWYLPARNGSTASQELMSELTTPRGQRAELTLPDGSHVVLGPDSRLRYSTSEFRTRRDLHLEGEAYFDVVHDDSRPMRVFTSRGVTEDLGTAFAVSDHPKGLMRVVVAEGSVLLRTTADGPASAADSVVLEARDLGQLGRDGRLSARRNIDVDSYLAWRDGRLIFRGTPLREVLFRLSTWYDIDVELGDSGLADRPFTASFPRHENTDQVLRTLSLALGVRFERRGTLLLVLPGTTAVQP